MNGFPSIAYTMGYQYALNIAYMFSGWTEALSCRKADAKIMVKKLLENVFSLWCIPREISVRETCFAK